MHGGHAGEDEPMAEMNLIPLIDVALTLLIIMMVTSAFIKPPGVGLKLPETATREGAPEAKKDLIIVIAKNGKLYIDGRMNSKAQVQAQLAVVAKKDKEARVLVKGDRAVAYESIMGVMDMVRQAGLTRVILPTDPIPVRRPAPGPVADSAPPATDGRTFR